MHCLEIGPIHLYNILDVLRTSMCFAIAHTLFFKVT